MSSSAPSYKFSSNIMKSVLFFIDLHKVNPRDNRTISTMRLLKSFYHRVKVTISPLIYFTEGKTVFSRNCIFGLDIYLDDHKLLSKFASLPIFYKNRILNLHKDTKQQSDDCSCNVFFLKTFRDQIHPQQNSISSFFGMSCTFPVFHFSHLIYLHVTVFLYSFCIQL